MVACGGGRGGEGSWAVAGVGGLQVAGGQVAVAGVVAGAGGLQVAGVLVGEQECNHQNCLCAGMGPEISNQ